ncbi:MAG: sodium:solute symporter family protein [Verrucomicrobiota bacterium]|nr:sodium:solute symporter family protein [Verrucomicrobiota bacterium]
MIIFAASTSTIPLWVVLGYLVLLLGLGIFSSKFFRGTTKDFFVASRSIGSFMLLMSVFGTTMTGFALVGSSGKAFTTGVATYGAVAAWSGIIHSAIFFIIGLRLWAIGKRHGYVTQVQFFRDRFNSQTLGTVLFVLLVLLIIPYLLIGIISAGKFVQGTTQGMVEGGIAPWITGLVICGVVLTYVFLGGVRSTAWANTFQTLVFMFTGIVAFLMISSAVAQKNPEYNPKEAGIIYNIKRATEYVETHKPERLARGVHPGAAAKYEEQQQEYEEQMMEAMNNEAAGGAEMKGLEEPTVPKPSMTHLVFITFLFIPVSIGMFPHVFQHWLTAKDAKTFRLAIVAHPICIAIVWLPCILIGVWAAGLAAAGDISISNPSEVLGTMVNLIANPWLLGLLMAGVLAAIMSSLDSQFACLGTMFTNDIVIPIRGKDYYSDADTLKLARIFVVGVVAVAYLASLALMETASVFGLGIWCFTGFAALFPIVFAALYWKRVTAVGVYACMAVTTGLWVFWFHQSGYGADKHFLVLGMLPIAPLTLASAAALVIGSLCSSPPEARLVNRFFPRANNSNDSRGSNDRSSRD